jgi:tetratricopeptide (TPR) repeat protein
MPLAAACAGGPRRTAVTPADIPTLQAQVQSQPANAAVRFRLAAALFAAGRCDTAVVVAHAALRLQPDNVLGPLVVGGCQERAQRYDLAVETYESFADRYPRNPGTPALRAKAQDAVRKGALRAARLALAREAELTALPPEPRTLAVLPVTVSGDTSYRALSRGLAELMITDLAVIRSLRLLERVQVGTLLEELRLAQGERVNPATAARMGHLLRAERMVQGVASIVSERAPVRLQVTVVSVDGASKPGAAVTGPFRDLLDLEKQLVIGLGRELGIQITDAERQRILRQGPKNLVAFLAYSRGLESLDRGDYGGAARHFGDAVRADPSFTAAEDARQAAEAAPAVDRAGADLATVVDAGQGEAPRRTTESSGGGALETTTRDVGRTLGDAIGPVVGDGTESLLRELLPESRGLTNLQGASAIIRIIFRRPK